MIDQLPAILVAFGSVLVGYGACARRWQRVVLVLVGVALAMGAEPIGLRAQIWTLESEGDMNRVASYFRGGGPYWNEEFLLKKNEPAVARAALAIADDMEKAISLAWEDLEQFRVTGELPYSAAWVFVHEYLSTLPPQRDLIEVIGAERATRLTDAAGAMLAQYVREVHKGWWMDGALRDLPAAILVACLRDPVAAELLEAGCCDELIARRLFLNSGERLMISGLRGPQVEHLGLEVRRLAWIDELGVQHPIPVDGTATLRRYGAVLAFGGLTPPAKWNGTILIDGQWIVDDGIGRIGVRSNEARPFGKARTFIVEVRSEITREPAFEFSGERRGNGERP